MSIDQLIGLAGFLCLYGVAVLAVGVVCAAVDVVVAGIQRWIRKGKS